MVFMRPRDGDYQGLADYLAGKGILVDAAKKIRLVTHLDVSRADIDKVVDAIKRYYA